MNNLEKIKFLGALFLLSIYFIVVLHMEYTNHVDPRHNKQINVD